MSTGAEATTDPAVGTETAAATTDVMTGAESVGTTETKTARENGTGTERGTIGHGGTTSSLHQTKSIYHLRLRANKECFQQPQPRSPHLLSTRVLRYQQLRIATQIPLHKMVESPLKNKQTLFLRRQNPCLLR